MNGFLLALPLLMLALAAQASETKHSPASKYAGQEERTIKSLSPDDIAELERGGGWGLAKAAELNGVPGPTHLLKMKDIIPLDEAQVSTITAIFKRMKTNAIEQGRKLIALERELEGYFRNRSITDALLRSSLGAIAEARRELRYTHLATHLMTPEILSPEQIERYNDLRGYTDKDHSAANASEGHGGAGDGDADGNHGLHQPAQ